MRISVRGPKRTCGLCGHTDENPLHVSACETKDGATTWLCHIDDMDGKGHSCYTRWLHGERSLNS